MNRIEEQLKKLRNLTLTNEERSRMRAELLAYAELHAGSAVSAPVRSPFSILRIRLYAGMTAAVLLIAALGGTAYASESALPGDALYPVKVGIAEPIQTALVPSDRGKAAWHAILAERRLEEAADLAARGRLSTQTQDALAQNFNANVSASQMNADRLQHEGDTSGSLSVRSDLEARLAAHAEILAVIDAHYASASTTDGMDTHMALGRLLALVKGHEQDVASSRLALEDSISPGTEEDGDTHKGNSTTAMLALSGKHSKQGIEVQGKHLVRETPAAQIETAATARTTEVKDILERHAAFLATFFPNASTTATSTATTTATTTASTTQDVEEKGKLEHSHMDEVEIFEIKNK